MHKVSFYAWMITKEAEDLIARMAEAVRAMLPKDYPVEIKVIDVASYGEVKHDSSYWGVVFGKKAKQHVEGDQEKIFEVPCPDKLLPLPKNKKHRSQATRTLKKLSSAIVLPEKEEKIETYALTKEGITVGKNGTDIEIPEEVLKYLKEIKDFLGGCKVVITKGDLKIEVE